MVARILVPLDGSLPATMSLKIAERLADRWGSELHILTLVERGQEPEALDYVIERQVSRLREHPRVEVRTMTVGVAEDIAEEFGRVDDSLVVMSTWARGRSAGLMHNVSEDVLQLVGAPILVVGPDVEIDDRWPEGPMFVTTDGSHFAESVVPEAVRLAGSLDLGVRLLTVIDPAVVPAGVNPVAESNAVAQLSEVIGSRLGRGVDFDVLHGHHPATELADYVNRYDGSVVVMSTHGRSGMARIAVGSVAMDVVRRAACPVLLVPAPVDGS